MVVNLYQGSFYAIFEAVFNKVTFIFQTICVQMIMSIEYVRRAGNVFDF